MKSLDIASINNKIELLHPCTNEFWGNEQVRKEFLEFLAVWSKNPIAYFKKTFAAQETTNTKQQNKQEDEIKVGFVDGLFEM